MMKPLRNAKKKTKKRNAALLMMMAVLFFSLAGLFFSRRNRPFSSVSSHQNNDQKGSSDDAKEEEPSSLSSSSAGERSALLEKKENEKEVQKKTERYECPDVHKNCEYDGAVVLDGVAVGPTKSISDCCEKCANTSGCNVYVFCDESWCKGQCWLKRVENPDVERPKLRNGATEGDANVPWTSGMLMKDFVKSENAGEEGGGETRVKTLKEQVSIQTPVGKFTIHLKPEWHRKSVEYLTDLAETENACQGKSCKLYRVEPGFLVQGVLRSFVVRANKETFQFQKLMEYGDVGWAGGSAGPDFFVYLGEKPATWLKFDHTIWGTVEDPASLEVLEKIVKTDSHTPGGPNTMRFLKEEMPISVL